MLTLSVGIPRGLTYYYLYPFFEGFLNSLGIEVTVSTATNPRTLSLLTCCPTDEPCISVKLYYPHTKELLEKGVDYIFIPVLSSLEAQSYCCPKFMGVAFMVQSGLGIPAEKILAPEINEKEKPGSGNKNLYALGERLGAGERRVRQAIKDGTRRQEMFHRLTRDGLTVEEAYACLAGRSLGKKRVFDPGARHDPGQVFGVMGHPYVLYDYVGHNIVARLKEYGRVITAEMVSFADSKKELAFVYEGEKMWTYEGRLLGAALYLLRRRLVGKMVFAQAFACGPASIIEPYIEEEAMRQGIPFLSLTLDEHTGEAGLVTRLEAFVDTASGCFTKLPEKKIAPAFVPRARPARLKVGAPTVGWSGKALASTLEECGVEIVPARALTRRTVDLGKELAPEFICYPMVTVLGQMREMIAAGANLIVMVGGKGRCRLGWYAQLQELLLKRTGCDFQLVIIDSPLPFWQNWRRFKEAVRVVTNNSSWRKLLRGFYLGYLQMKALDEAERLVRRKQAYERERGAARFLHQSFIQRVLSLRDPKAIDRVKLEFSRELDALPEERLVPLKVNIIGEFYAVIEKFVNHDVEGFLTSRPGLRVQVERDMTASGWFDLHVLRKKKLVKNYRQVITAAAPYLPVSVGGHGQESVGEMVKAKQNGADGVIHLFPFTCMPEIVSQSILLPLSQQLDLPFLSLAVNEQTGTAGLETRLEAFLDVLQERAEKRKISF